MDIDERLSLALQQYGTVRRLIGQGIRQGIPGVPNVGGRDTLLWIARLEQPNITALAETLGMTRGGTSKATARLQEAGLVESYQLPQNRKEVYLRLTPEGEAAAARMRRALDCLHSREMAFLATLAEEEKQGALTFIEAFTRYLSAGLGDKQPEEEDDA